MFYTIKEFSDLHMQLAKLREKCLEAKKAQSDILNEVGTTKFYQEACHLVGRIVGFNLDACPDGWQRKFKSQSDNCFFPKNPAKNKGILARINAQPVVHFNELNALIGYGDYFGPDLQMSTRPEWFKFLDDGRALIKIPDWVMKDYKPVEGMEEVLASEFHRIWEAEKEKEDAKPSGD
jgi:hypothetical protein